MYFLVICGTTDAEEDKLLHCYRVATDSTKQSTEEQPPAAGEGDAEAAATEATDPDDVRDASLFNCPDAHGLFAFTTSTRTWTCSVCLGSIPAGSRAFGCRRCNYDVCSSCGLSPDGGIKVVESGPVNCPGQHGFALFTAPNSFFCDVCLGPIPAGARAYGCRQCDNDVCTSCSMGSAAFGVSGDAPIEGGALVEASQEDAAYNRAVIEDRAREAQQAQQERMRLEQHRIEMMSIASAGATIARFQHL